MQVTYTGMLAPKLARLAALEEAIRSMPQASVRTHHDFAPGIYTRTIELEAGSVLTGRVHKTEHIFILSAGKMTIVTEDKSGQKRATIEAPYQCVSKPGVKRAGYAHTPCVCSNVHITTETDLLKLEASLVEPETHALQAPKEVAWLG